MVVGSCTVCDIVLEAGCSMGVPVIVDVAVVCAFIADVMVGDVVVGVVEGCDMFYGTV